MPELAVRLRPILAALVCGALFAVPSARATPFGSSVVAYQPGSNAPPGYTDPSVALGPPARATGSGAFDGDLTPFNAPYLAQDVVSIGAGGSLVLRFDHPVVDDPQDPYGVDLLVYGNAFLGIDFATGRADGTLFDEPARIALSQDGQSWFEVSGRSADSLFPTLAYTDPTGPFSFGGTQPTSFTRPVDPSLTAASFKGLDVAAIAALYAGGAGGAGVDLGALGLPWIQYVRISQPQGDTWSAEVDAIADVPEPAQRGLLALGAAVCLLTRARSTQAYPRRCTGRQR
jgi:hypothetical protein